MISLFISTATKRLIISLIKNDEIIYNYNEYNDNTLSERIMPVLDDALNKSQIDINDIDNIYVVNGPGSFTGIRVGITIAKTLAWTLNKNIYTISSLELLSSTNVNTKYIAPLIDARRGYVFAGLYDNNLNNIISEQHILLDDFKELIKDYEYTYIAEDSFNFDVSPSKYDILKLINKHKNDDSLNPHVIIPNYLKLTEAEEKYNNDKKN